MSSATTISVENANGTPEVTHGSSRLWTPSLYSGRHSTRVLPMLHSLQFHEQQRYVFVVGIVLFSSSVLLPQFPASASCWSGFGSSNWGTPIGSDELVK